ncbi:alkylmercury lyase (plasmid) [Halobellus limi]|uniref:Alkylmercury lyase n=2 Tax=Halobellus limi TaxID=699433 RepID=A0A1H6BSF1_9EURY|nr:alkylmercury lyase [Halobellus limi]SEG63375.1 Alkylmercury lyase [Halobellus limi]
MCNANTDSTTTDAADTCCSSNAQKTNGDRVKTHWLDGPDLLDQPLPDDLQSALGRLFGRDSVETLAEWAREIRQRTGGGSIDVDQLCHTDDETAHWGDVDGERFHFQCFYDAVILAALEDRAVDIHTVSPRGAVVEARAVGSEKLSVTPETAVFSLGIASDAHKQSSGDPTLQDNYATVCPYVKAFPDRDAYKAWADEVPAATVATPLAGATAFARALTDERTRDQ